MAETVQIKVDRETKTFTGIEQLDVGGTIWISSDEAYQDSATILSRRNIGNASTSGYTFYMRDTLSFDSLNAATYEFVVNFGLGFKGIKIDVVSRTVYFKNASDVYISVYTYGSGWASSLYSTIAIIGGSDSANADLWYWLSSNVDFERTDLDQIILYINAIAAKFNQKYGGGTSANLAALVNKFMKL